MEEGEIVAEFVQTMKDWRRMCQYMDKEYGNSCCDHCPLGGCSAVYEMCGKENFANMEHDITAWAAKHPEPIYPTWVEWLQQQRVLDDYHGGMACLNISALHPIPAEIAEKLGIEPKEG